MYIFEKKLSTISRKQPNLFQLWNLEMISFRGTSHQWFSMNFKENENQKFDFSKYFTLLFILLEVDKRTIEIISQIDLI